MNFLSRQYFEWENLEIVRPNLPWLVRWLFQSQKKQAPIFLVPENLDSLKIIHVFLCSFLSWFGTNQKERLLLFSSIKALCEDLELMNSWDLVGWILLLFFFLSFYFPGLGLHFVTCRDMSLCWFHHLEHGTHFGLKSHHLEVQIQLSWCFRKVGNSTWYPNFV